MAALFSADHSWVNQIIFPAPEASYNVSDFNGEDTPEAQGGRLVWVPRRQAAVRYGRSLKVQLDQCRPLQLPWCSCVFAQSQFRLLNRWWLRSWLFGRRQTMEHDPNSVPCLFFEHKGGASRIMLFCHGNSEDIGNTVPMLYRIRDR